MRALATFALLAALLVGCGDDLAPEVADVAGTWSYDWQTRENGEPYAGWDGHFRGELVLVQHGADVTGMLGYPVEDPETLFGAAGLRDAWIWMLYGVVADDGLHLFAVAPRAVYDDDWRFILKVGATEMSGPSWAGLADVQKWPFRATRSGSLE